MHTHVHTHTCTHKCACAHTRTHTYTCTRTHKRARTHDLRARARYFTIWGGNQEGNSRACWLAPPTEACGKLRGTPLDGVLMSQAEHRAKTARSGRIRVVALDSSGHRSRAKARPCGTTSCGARRTAAGPRVISSPPTPRGVLSRTQAVPLLRSQAGQGRSPASVARRSRPGRGPGRFLPASPRRPRPCSAAARPRPRVRAPPHPATLRSNTGSRFLLRSLVHGPSAAAPKLCLYLVWDP